MTSSTPRGDSEERVVLSRGACQRRRVVRALLGSLFVLASCSGPEAAPHAQSRSALDGVGSLDPRPVTVGGAADVRLGASVAACPGGGFVAGSLSNSQAFFSPSRGLLQLPPLLPPLPTISQQSSSAACVREQGLVRGFVGGARSVLALEPDGGVTPLGNFRVDAMAASTRDPLVFADGETGVVGLYRPGLTSLIQAPNVTRTRGFGRSVTWNGFRGLVVGDPLARQVTTIVAAGDGGLFAFPPRQDPTTQSISGFGHAVAAGSVTNDFNDEVLVGAPGLGKVFIFSSPVIVLEDAVGFGAAIAVDPRPFGDPTNTVHPFWVSNATTGELFYYLGTERISVVPAGFPDAGLGTSLAVLGDGRVAVGAPLYSTGACAECGAVFLASVDAGIRGGTGVSPACVVGDPCVLDGCRSGICVGTVFCAEVASLCAAGESCVNNRCLPPNRDAGPPDAGPPDAGPPDAGEGAADAGDGGAVEGDAGVEPQFFTARSCSTGTGLAAWLALVLSRRAFSPWGRRRHLAKGPCASSR